MSHFCIKISNNTLTFLLFGLCSYIKYFQQTQFCSNPEKSEILFEIMVHFILALVALILSNVTKHKHNNGGFSTKKTTTPMIPRYLHLLSCFDEKAWCSEITYCAFNCIKKKKNRTRDSNVYNVTDIIVQTQECLFFFMAE